ncbi:MAG: glycosyltransferase [Candidatus Woesearchaeota archaeon]
MKPKYTIGIGVTNNEIETIPLMLESLSADISSSQIKKRDLETLICLNNFDYGKLLDVERIANIYSNLNIRLTSSENGLIKAQRKIIQDSNGTSDFIIFYDADIQILNGSTYNLIRAMEDNPSIYAASGDQIPFERNSILYKIINIEALKPKLSTPERKYIIGKDFAIRKNSYYIPEGIITDDTFLSYYLIHNFGKEAVKRIEGVYVKYYGPATIKDYFNKIKRISLESKKIFDKYPEFLELREYFKREIDSYEYDKLTSSEKIQLWLHDRLKDCCKIALPYFENDEVWATLTTTKKKWK